MMAATARRNTSTVRYNRSASALSRADFHCSSSVIAFCLPVASCTARSMCCCSFAFCSLSSRIASSRSLTSACRSAFSFMNLLQPLVFCAAQNRIGGKCIYLFTQQPHEYGKKTSHCTLSLDTRHQCFRPIAIGQLGRHARSGRKQTAPCIQFRQGRKRQHHMQHGQPRPGCQGHSGQRKHRGQRGDNRQHSGTRSDIRSHHEKRPYHGHIQAVGLQFRPDAAPRQERGAPAAKPAASVSIHD